MIIKFTIKDSDVTYYFKEFCEHVLTWRWFDPIDATSSNQFDDVKLLRETYDKIKEKRDYLLDTSKRWGKDSNEQKEIIAEILRLWESFASENHLNFVPKISISYTLSEKDENGESFYFFSRSHSYVVM